MEFPATSTESSPLAHDKASPARGIVSRGTARLAANSAPLASLASTSAACVVLPHTPPNSVPSSHDLLPIKTPFIPDVWETMLNDITPFNSFPDIPISLRFCFDMGVHTPPTQTYIPPNHNSALSFPDHILSHIQKKLSLGRYSGPFSRSDLESLIGPFHTSPLGIVPKTVGSTKRRIVQDLSFPRDDPSRSSINDQINIEDFTCDWGTFTDMRRIIIDAPPFSEAATLDVDSAFRCCPITPSQQRNFIIHWNGSFYIDHCALFSATSAGGVFGRVADAKSAILKSKNIGPSKKWVDDFMFFRIPISIDSGSPSFSYSLSNIYHLASQLGWPWKESKTRPFSPEFI